jgi:Ca2+-binding RTX toxin-like protein
MSSFTIDTDSIVNTTTTGAQQDPAVTGLSDGGWVVTWAANAQDGNSYGIVQQRYNADGTANGSETVVNTYTSSYQYYPSASGLSDGGWVVTWMSYQQDGSGYGIYQQRYDADGTANGGETHVGTTTSSEQTYPDVTALSDGGWLVSWSSYNVSGGGYGVRQQRYDANGATVGSETTVNTTTTTQSYETRLSVTNLDDGGWVVTWQNGGDYDDWDNNSNNNVYQQRYDANGNTVGSEVVVAQLSNSYMMGGTYPPGIVALDDGGWVVSWSGYNSGALQMQRYDVNGNAVGSAVSVSGTSTYYTQSCMVATADGGWAVIWHEYNSANSTYDIFMRLYDTDGNAVGDPTMVNSTTASHQYLPQVAELEDGSFVVTWMDYSTGSNYDIVQTVVSFTENSTVTLAEDSSHAFTQSEFAFSVEDGDTLVSIHVTNLPGSGTLTLDGDAVQVGDTISAADLDKLVWTPVANANGDALASFKFTSLDNNGTVKTGKVTFDVSAVNDAPTATDNTLTLAEDGSHTFAASEFGFADIDSGDALASVVISGLPSSGTLTLNGQAVQANDAIAVGDIGNLVWTPDADDSGTALDTLKFKVTDGNGGTSAERTLTFDVTAAADAPTASDNTVTLNEDGSHAFAAADFQFEDVDGDSLSGVVITNLPAAGTLTLDGQAVTANQTIAAADLSKLVWTPPANGSGNGFAELQFKVIDSTDTPSATAHTLTFNVTAVNDAPTAADNSVTLAEDGSHTFTASEFGFLDSVESDTLASIRITELPSSGSLTLNGVAVSTNQVILQADIGNLTWTPDADDNGTALDTLKFKVTDSGGATSANNYTITFNVTAEPDAPTAANDTITVLEDSAHTFSATDFGFDDIDGDTLASVTITALPSTGTLKLDGVAVTANQVIAAASIGSLVWTPDAEDSDGVTSFSFKVTDSDGETSANANTITLDVEPVNDAPTVLDDEASLTEGKSVTVDVLGNDEDINGDDLDISDASVTSGDGTVTINKQGKLVVAYTGADLDPGQTATITVHYEASDGHDVDEGTLTVTVNGVAEAGDDITGTPKKDTLVGTNAGERIFGLADDDVIKGRDGNDIISASDGDDTVDGGNDNDDITGGSGNDALKGGNGDDIIAASTGNDRVDGGSGDDELSGGLGKDVVIGGDGNDVINGWGGNDVMTGGNGIDVFIFRAGDGKDKITDFETGGANHDVIDLREYEGLDAFSDIKGAMKQSGDDVLIELAGKTDIRLQDVELSDLTGDHFLF